MENIFRLVIATFGALTGLTNLADWGADTSGQINPRQTGYGSTMPTL